MAGAVVNAATALGDGSIVGNLSGATVDRATIASAASSTHRAGGASPRSYVTVEDGALIRGRRDGGARPRPHRGPRRP